MSDAADVIPILLVAGASVNAKEREGRTALFFAALRGCTGSVAALIEGGAGPGATATKGEHRDGPGSMVRMGAHDLHHECPAATCGGTSRKLPPVELLIGLPASERRRMRVRAPGRLFGLWQSLMKGKGPVDHRLTSAVRSAWTRAVEDSASLKGAPKVIEVAPLRRDWRIHPGIAAGWSRAYEDGALRHPTDLVCIAHDRREGAAILRERIQEDRG